MHTARIIPSRHQEQAPNVETPVRPAIPGKRRGWRQRFRRWYAGWPSAGRQPRVPRQLKDRWDAQHERVQVRVQATEDRLDYITRTKPRLGLEIYVTFS